MAYNDYLKEIIKFNSDKELVSLREMYNRPSFFEIISKARSETTFSAFLRWLLLENSTENNVANPIQLLLNVLVRRCEEQQPYHNKTILIKDDIKESIATKQFKILSAKVEIEKNVGGLAQIILDDKSLRLNQPRMEQLKKIAAKSQDRIDLFIECEVEKDGKKGDILQIIIENKIDSKEGGTKKNKTGDVAYDNAQQTTRYFLGTNLNNNRIVQIYVYLTPLPSRNLDNFQNLEHENKCSDSNFIQVNYQDIVDGIAMPMLASSSLSSRTRFFLQEFVNELTFPSIEGNAVHSSIALSSEYMENLTVIWIKYKKLIVDASVAAAERDFWIMNTDTYFDHQPREEMLVFMRDNYSTELNELIKNQIVEQNGNSYQWKKGVSFTKIQKSINSIKVEKVQATDTKTTELLTNFWEENKRFLTALMDGINEEERKKVECLLKEVTKRDNTKYNVFYNGNKYNNQPLGKGETAHEIVKIWAKEVMKDNFGLDDLREAFPIRYNSYYSNAKYFLYLFYKKNVTNNYSYDGNDPNLNGLQVEGNFDFDRRNKFDITNNKNEVFIMLKMWRKEGLEEFIKYVKKMPAFKNLEVQEA